jgi:hypothetical protein
MDKLLEMILLQADLLELKANPNRNAKGNVIESGRRTGRPDGHGAGAQRHAALGDVMIVRRVLRRSARSSTRKASGSRKPGRPSR